MKEYIFIDFEMDVNCDNNPEQIIAIGAIKTNNNGEIIDSYESYSKLKNKPFLYRYTTFLTGIKDSNLKNSPSFKNNLIELEKFIGQSTEIYCWGDCDLKCLKKTSNLNNIKSELLENNMKDFREFLPKKYRKYYWEKLFNIAKEFKIIEKNKNQKHNSIEDAIILKEIFFKMKEDEQNG